MEAVRLSRAVQNARFAFREGVRAKMIVRRLLQERTRFGSRRDRPALSHIDSGANGLRDCLRLQNCCAKPREERTDFGGQVGRDGGALTKTPKEPRSHRLANPR